MVPHRALLLFAIFVSASAPRADCQSQDRFVNFETPQTHPIDIAHVGGREYVLVCNTPDNSVEIYRASPPHACVRRVPVGMGPATVRWNAGMSRFYVCNFDGDSISVVRMEVVGNALDIALERTFQVPGDEPSDIAFNPDNTMARISLSGQSAVFDVILASLLPGNLPTSTPPAPLTGPASGPSIAVKTPRALAWLPDGRFFAANLRGGSPSTPGVDYDLGLFLADSSGPATLGGLGSTNHAFAMSPDAELLFMVGTKAQNHFVTGVVEASQAPTGFVQSWLMVVDVPPGMGMTVRPEAPAGAPPATPLPSINLNRDYSMPGRIEVDTDDALVQPTGIVVLGNGAGGISKIALTAYHSDRVALLQPNPSVPGGYSIQRVDLPPLAGGSYTVMGPRGLVYAPNNQRLFVNGRLDNSLAVIDPSTAQVTYRIALQHDPTPPEIRIGREFLYSNRFSIHQVPPSHEKTGGFVACASCHVDAGLDGLTWDLGHVDDGPNFPPGLHDPLTSGSGSIAGGFFPSQKGPLTTQTLQGLVNFQVNEDFQFMATNAPYHWRGDKEDFIDFNEAFVNLQGMANVGTTAEPMGILEDKMKDFRRFINTVRHPPNPEQDLSRVTPGTLDPVDPNDFNDGNSPGGASGEKLGLVLYHNKEVRIRSCVGCHSLPEGSSNTVTEAFSVHRTLDPPPSGEGTQPHPFESAALRNIAQREMVLEFGGVEYTTANHGLFHSGKEPTGTNFEFKSIDAFMENFPALEAHQQAAVAAFVRQLDTGTAPAAGVVRTVNPGDPGGNQAALDLLEAQVGEANVGLGAYTRNNGIEAGYWYDVTITPPAYRKEGTNDLLTRAQLLDLAQGSGNLVMLQATPLGIERRWASANGMATPIPGPAPSGFTLLPMAPNTAYVDIAKLDLGIDPDPDHRTTPWALRTLQSAVENSAHPGGGFGVTHVRHEPPRRFRITGDDIRVGATMLFGISTDRDNAPTLSSPFEFLEMELFPTDKRTPPPESKVIWETEAELDAMQTLALLNGGYWAPDVEDVLLRNFHPTGPQPNLQPVGWNHYLIGVRNADGTQGLADTLFRLTVQDGR